MIKKMCSFFIALILIMSCALVVFAMGNETEILPAPDFSLGDVNMDKAVNVKDATAVQKHLADIATLDEEELLLADVDQNASVNIKDATYIQKQVAGLVPPAAFKPSVTTTQTVSETPVVTETEADVVSSENLTSAPVVTDITSSEVSETTIPSEVVTFSQPADVTTPVPTSVPQSSTTVTENPTTETPTEIPTQITTTEAPTEKPTRDPNKPIELPFVPAM